MAVLNDLMCLSCLLVVFDVFNYDLSCILSRDDDVFFFLQVWCVMCSLATVGCYLAFHLWYAFLSHHSSDSASLMIVWWLCLICDTRPYVAWQCVGLNLWYVFCHDVCR